MDPVIEAAFKHISRRDFLPPDMAVNADQNMPLPIGYGQTNSQPETVQRMLEWLQIEPGDNILDVGSGSGWTSALLAYLTGKHGRVTAIEIVPELVASGRENVAKTGIKNIEFHQAGKTVGWPANAPYDKILVSAAATEIPETLLEQLVENGRAVIPVGPAIVVIDKDEQGNTIQTPHVGYVFVPLVLPAQ
ncbi:MAG TPA: protein-L-isoaspartate O-methyltransferase [Candidatus Saccharimonadales bacterium]|nr:protein-L-isoaspartate O-methyltransferase [Candidatus Saccharimonadales bacterium]